MAVTKRTRYEVLNRDNFACRYCGGAAPDVKLTVDHVTPIALGGTDDPSNLVAACADCNAGKASTNPDAELVADVADDALRYAELTRQAYAVLVEQIQKRAEYIDEFLGDWGGYLPDDWRSTIGRWHRMGVPIEIVTEAASIAMEASTVPMRNKFKYMCGVVWNQVRTVTEEARTKLGLDGAWMTSDEMDEFSQLEWTQGHENGRRRMLEEHISAIYGGAMLEAVIDGVPDTVPPEFRVGV